MIKIDKIKENDEFKYIVQLDERNIHYFDLHSLVTLRDGINEIINNDGKILDE